MATYGKRSKTKNVATGRFTLCQARASLRPFNIGRWPMSRDSAIYPGSRSKLGKLRPAQLTRGPTQDNTAHKGAGPRSCGRADGLLDPLPLDGCSRWATGKSKLR